MQTHYKKKIYSYCMNSQYYLNYCATSYRIVWDQCRRY